MRKRIIGFVCGLAGLGIFACAEPDGPDAPNRGEVVSYEVSPDDRYIIKFRTSALWASPGAAMVAGKRATQAAGGAIVLELAAHDAVAAVVPAARLSDLFSDPSIEYIEVDRRRKLLSTYPYPQATPFGIPYVQADQVPDSEAGNRTVCIIDSGYAVGHVDLPGTGNVDGAPDGGAGPWNEDGDGHGTHVAGTIAAIGNSEGVVGVLPNSNINLYIVRVFGNDGTWAYSSDLVAALQACTNAGANVVSMSLGGPDFSTTEDTAFADAYAAGVLSVAAASNDSDSSYSYPASYETVISVAAINEFMLHADFSNTNDDVEIAAPGVAVRSTVPMGTGTYVELSVGSDPYQGIAFENTPRTSGSGPLMNCGTGKKRCKNAGGKVCLIKRGGNAFAAKVRNCANGGGVAAVIYNNVHSPLSGATLGDGNVSIPAVGISDTDGDTLLARLGDIATVSVSADDYEYYDGTSMATPHVSAVAALVWSYNTTDWSNQDIRHAMNATAVDLGDPGRDIYFGFGLVQAKDALEYLQTPCVPDPEVCDDDADNDCDGAVDCADPDCEQDAACNVQTESDCGDGVDNDGDGAIDCDDGDCDGDPVCEPTGDGGQCSTCESNSQCDDGFACVPLSGQEFAYCLQRCGKKGTPCTSGYSCVRITGGYGQRCVSCE